jgi:protein-tyrosine-phosphatase/DNA-binding HxlR family transcriptional regulator
MDTEQVSHRARLHGALGDPIRLAIVDELTSTDRSPSELAAMLAIDSNLLAHHLGVLEELGIVERIGSQGDRRRRYIRLIPTALDGLHPGGPICAGRIVFVCTENAARSQLAQAIWNQTSSVLAISGGTHPAEHLHRGAIEAAERRGIDLRHAWPRPVPDIEAGDLVITVCDRAHESLRSRPSIQQLHWSVPDPATSRDRDGYDQSVFALESRINLLAPNLQLTPGPGE